MPSRIASGRPVPELAVGVGSGGGRCVPHVGRQLRREVDDVVGLVAVVGDGLARA